VISNDFAASACASPDQRSLTKAASVATNKLTMLRLFSTTDTPHIIKVARVRTQNRFPLLLTAR
jgi:hypothetical protein